MDNEGKMGVLTQRNPELAAVRIEDYELHPQEEVRRILGEEFKYGPSKQYVDAIYLHKSENKAVGVTRVTEEMCEGHFEGLPIMRGVDQTEAMAQTLLLMQKIRGAIPVGQSPRLVSSSSEFRSAALPGMVINILVAADEKNTGGIGKIYNGDTLISEGKIGGVMLPDKFSEALLQKVRNNVSEPKFPLP